MKIFFDTSSLVKLYHKEEGTELLEAIFASKQVTRIYLSEISKIEFASTIWKKVRINEIKEQEAQITLDLFSSDLGKYTFITTDSIIIEQARILISKYGPQGLRTLDSLQLSTAISLNQHADVFFTSDKLLRSLFKAENLPTEVNP